MSEFNPQPEEWYAATLADAFPDKGFFLALLSNGEEVYVHCRAVSYGGDGKHTFCLQWGTPMVLRVESQDSTHRFRYRAIECQIEANESATTREEAVIEHWRGNSGSARRPCRCTIFVKAGNEPNDGLGLQVGDTVTIDVAFSDYRGDFMGTVTDELQ